MQDIAIFAAISALFMKSVNSQILNIKKGNFNKLLNFCIAILISCIVVFTAIHQSFYQFTIFQNINGYDEVIIMIATAFAATGSFDTLKDICKMFGRKGK